MADLPTPDVCAEQAAVLLTTYEGEPRDDIDADTARVATAWIGLASVQLQQQHLELSRAADVRADEQLKIQRMAVGPIGEVAKLTEQIAACEHGRWTAGDVNDWIQQAARIQAALQ